MAAIVFVVIVTQLCWTVAQLNTTEAETTAHNASTPRFELCRLNEGFHNMWHFVLYKQLSGSSTFYEEKDVTDLWASDCEVRVANGSEIAVSGNPLEYNRDNIYSVRITNSNITSFPDEFFCHFPNLKLLNLTNNRLNDSTKLGLGFNYNCSPNNCAHQLSFLRLSGNPLRVIKKNSFCLLQGLRSLSLDKCELVSVESEAFSKLKSSVGFSHIDLSHNAIRSIEEGAFDNMPEIYYLNLNNNELQNLNKTFSHLSAESLSLNNNQLTHLSLDYISRNSRKIYLRGNFISHLSYGLDRTQATALTLIDLSDNKLTRFDDFVLPRSVSTVILSNNNISFMSIELNYLTAISQGETSLQEVDLQNNSFSVAPVLPQHRNVYDKCTPIYKFHGNPLKCSCENTWFLMTSKTEEIEDKPPCIPLAKVKASHLVPKDNILTTSLLCESSYNNSERCKIPQRDFYTQSLKELKECEFQCPKPCYCYTTFNFSMVHLYCSQTQLNSIPQLLDKRVNESEVILWLDGNNFNTINSTDFDIFPNVVRLYLNHSQIHTIDPLAFNNLTVLRVLNLNDNDLQSLPLGLFDHVIVLQELYLANNRLSDLADETFNHLKSLKMLHLHENRLTTFAAWNLKNLPSLNSVTLHDNRWSCDCSFIIKFREYLNNHNITIYNVDQLVCTAEDGHSQKSILEFDESLCLFDDNAILLTSIVSVCVLLIVSVSLSYRFRRELQLLVYSHVRRRVLSNVNESEGKLFDAFIAYSNDDFDFMYHNILPNLEGIDHPYRVCVHERDFLAGCVIADNILEAVRISSRTIILLTDNFVRSGWCRFEFKAAHLQMLEDRCPRVLVIVVGRIPANLEPEMLLYLKTNTYLTWGESFFWQKLYNSMPKQRATGVGVVTSPNVMPPEIEIDESSV